MRALLAAINCKKGDIDLNMETHRSAVEIAASAGCDIAVLPEMSLTGYLDPTRPDQVPIPINSAAVTRMCELSAEYRVGLLFGIAEANGGALPLISQIYATDGQVQAVYRKRHLGDNELGMYETGNESIVAESGRTKFGIAVCADRDVPDEFEFAVSSNARVVFHPSAPGLFPPRRTDAASWRSGFDWWRETCIDIHSKRAKALGISIAVVTQAGVTEDEDFPGWAGVIGPDGTVTAELPDWQAGTLVVDL